MNTQHCRTELDTVQYVIKKYGYRETRDTGDGNMYWYGVALRDNDIEHLKSRVCTINRYPLMDVSPSIYLIFFSTSPKKTFSA